MFDILYGLYIDALICAYSWVFLFYDMPLLPKMRVSLKTVIPTRAFEFRANV